MKTDPRSWEHQNHHGFLFLPGLGLMALPFACSASGFLSPVVFLVGLALAGRYGWQALTAWETLIHECRRLEDDNAALRHHCRQQFEPPDNLN